MKEKTKFDETKKLILLKAEEASGVSIYRQHKEDPDKEHVKIYSMEPDGIRYFLDGEKIKQLFFDSGYEELPKFVSSFGYGFDNNAVGAFFRKKFKGNVTTIHFTKKEKSSLKGKTIIVNHGDFETLLKAINQEQKACNDTKDILISNFLCQHFPELPFEYQETNNNKKQVLRNLNSKLIQQLNADEIEQIGKFYVEASQKYSRPDVVKKMLLDLQKNTQLITLQEIIKKYDALLKEDPPESRWQEFFDQYISLFDNRYITKLNYKNIATGITKYPDLVLVDIYGYVDFYELKKSGMTILQYDKSHKTFYWSKDVAMVIAQVSDYLQKAKENALSYSKSIKEETATPEEEGLDVNIICPRAIVVAGLSKEFNTTKKKNHFKNLRESLKDIEFILYDELLERLKNLLSVVKTDH